MHVPGWRRTTLTGPTKVNRHYTLALWGVFLGAAGLRLARLTFQPLWWDEGWSLYFATTDIRTLLELTAVDIHPPLYYLLLHFWIGLFGSSVVSVRLLSVLVGTATVPLLYVTGRRLLGKRGGLIAATLLAISPFHIYYSQEVRMYGLVTLLGLAALWLTLEWSGEDLGGRMGSRKWGSWLGFVLAATAALYTQYYALFLILALNLVFAIRWRRGGRAIREGWSWLTAQVAVLFLFAPWVWYAGEKLLTYVRFKVGVEQDQPLGLVTYLARHLAAFTWGHAEGLLVDWWWLGLLPLAILVLCLLGSWMLRVRNSPASGRPPSTAFRAPSSVILATTLLCGFVVNLVFPFTPPRSERLLLLALPTALILVAGAVLTLGRDRRTAAWGSAACFVVAAALSLSLFYTVPRYPDDDYRPVAERVSTLGLPSDAVLAVHPWQVGYFQAYLPDGETRPTLVLTPREVIPRERQLWADEPARMDAELDALLARHGRLWLLDHRTMGRVLEQQIEAYLVEHAYPVLSEWHGENTVLSLFATAEPTEQGVTARFGDWLSLEGAALSTGPLGAGRGIVAVDLSWQLSERPTAEYTVGLHLVGQTGHVWAQRDSLPGGGLKPFSEWPVGEPGLDRHGLLVPAGTPPGEYTLTLRVYRSGDLTVLPALFPGGSGGEVALGPVRVIRPETPPPVEALEFEHPLRVDLDRLRLVGYTLHDLDVWPGETVDVDLYWQALADPGEDFLPRLQLLDGDQVVAELVEKPVAGTYPTAWWRGGELVRDPHALPMQASTPAGTLTLAMSLLRAADGQPLEAERGQTRVVLGDIVVMERERRYEPTQPSHVQVARFGTSVELVGYDLADQSPLPGSPLAVTLHWHALETPDRNYYTFVHLLDAAGNPVAQHDGPPAGGNLPTLGWLPGETLTDTHLLQLPSDLPAGPYRLGVGFYDPVTFQRLGDRVLLDTSVVVGDEE